MISNPFFEATVRIEKERSHRVIAVGPYRYIRHPGYAGAILFYIAMPLMLGSWVAFIGALFGVAVYVGRTAMEDRTLRKELDGDQDYARQVCYRLLPGLW